MHAKPSKTSTGYTSNFKHMSLINQALRKAQQQRTPNRETTPADQTRAPQQNNYPQRSSTPKPGLLIGLIVGIAVLIGLVAGLTIIVLRNAPAPSAQPATAPVAAPAISQPALQPLTAAQPSTAPIQTSNSGSPSVLDELRQARQAAEAKAAEDTLATKKTAAQPSQDIIKWLSKARVSGVRLSGSGNKVILNNKAYSVGDTVNLALGLKVLIILEKRILFVAPNGKKYMKQI